MIKRLQQEEYTTLVRHHRALRKALEWSANVQNLMKEFVSNERSQEMLASTFEPSSDGLGAAIRTPFGDGRAIAVNAIVDGRIQVRYIFEKAVTFNDGSNGHVKLGEIRIDAEGQVTAEDGEQICSLDTFDGSEGFRAIRDVTVSVVYAIASNEHYSLSVE